MADSVTCGPGVAGRSHESNTPFGSSPRRWFWIEWPSLLRVKQYNSEFMVHQKTAMRYSEPPVRPSVKRGVFNLWQCPAVCCGGNTGYDWQFWMGSFWSPSGLCTALTFYPVITIFSQRLRSFGRSLLLDSGEELVNSEQVVEKHGGKYLWRGN